MLYIVELTQPVLDEPHFRKADSDHVAGKPCVYAGVTVSIRIWVSIDTSSAFRRTAL
jgi:hypothetical protein